MAHTTEVIPVAFGEILPLAISIARALDDGDAVQSVTVSLYEETSGALIINAITGTPAVTGTTLSFVLNTNALAPRNRYRATALLVIQPALKVVAVRIPITCDL